MDPARPIRSFDGGDVVVNGAVPDGIRAVDGRVPGRRGQATRQRLLNTTRAMLATTSYRDLRVVDIARAAGTSPATFYQYFADVPAAVLVLATDLADRGHDELAAVVTLGDWNAVGVDDPAGQLADAFVDFWHTNQALIRVVDLAALEGDPAFRAARVRLLNGVYVALQIVIERRPGGAPTPSVDAAQGDGTRPDPEATAGALTSMLSHVAAHVDGFGAEGVSAARLSAAMARVVRLALGPDGNQPEHDRPTS